MDVQELIDREEIRDAIYKLSRGMDRLDEPVIRAGYHPDGYDRHGAMDGTADDFVNGVMQYSTHTAMWPGAPSTIIDFFGSDVAQASTYIPAYQLQREVDEPRGVITHVGRYRDRL